MNEKAISVKQPWAYLLCSGIKDIENRTWKLPEKYIGERVFIHASMDKRLGLNELTKDQYNAVCDKFNWKTTTIKPAYGWGHGVIIGSVVFTGCEINHPSVWAEKSELTIDNITGLPVYEKPIYNWIASDAILFDKPISCKGKLSFWDCSHLIHSEPGENGIPAAVCLCDLPIKEEDQVLSLVDEYRCKYCGGVWYK